MYGGFFKITKLSVLGQITEKKNKFPFATFKNMLRRYLPGSRSATNFLTFSVAKKFIP